MDEVGIKPVAGCPNRQTHQTSRGNLGTGRDNGATARAFYPGIVPTRNKLNHQHTERIIIPHNVDLINPTLLN